MLLLMVELCWGPGLCCRADPLHWLSLKCNATTMHHSPEQHVHTHTGHTLWVVVFPTAFLWFKLLNDAFSTHADLWHVSSGSVIQPAGCANWLLLDRRTHTHTHTHTHTLTKTHTRVVDKAWENVDPPYFSSLVIINPPLIQQLLCNRCYNARVNLMLIRI